jgi:hypothetical protein
MHDAGTVTRPWPLRHWDPRRSLDVLANTGVTAAYLSTFITIRGLIRGRRLTVRTGGGRLELTVDDLVSRLDLRSVSAGRLDDIRLEARDVRWNGHALDRATAVLHGVHVTASMPPVLVAAPVDVSVDVPAATLDHLFRAGAPRLGGRVDDHGIARLHVARREGAGSLEVTARLDGSTLWLVPQAVVRRRRWSLPNRTPSYRIQLPDMPHGFRITDVDFVPGVVRISGTLDEWRADVPRTRLEDVVAQLSAAGGPLQVIWPGRDR